MNEILKREKIITECLIKFHNKTSYTPIRMVMMPMNQCFVCDVKKDTRSEYIDNHLRYSHYGYQYCVKCKCLIKIFKRLYEDAGCYIPSIKFNRKDLKKLKFLRISGNKNINPYIEVGWINLNEADIFRKSRDNNLTVLINWMDEQGVLFKNISLENLIFHNRDYFKYSAITSPLNKCSSFWKKMIRNSFDISSRPYKSFEIIENNFKNIHFDGLIRDLIIEFWKGDLI